MHGTKTLKKERTKLHIFSMGMVLKTEGCEGHHLIFRYTQ